MATFREMLSGGSNLSAQPSKEPSPLMQRLGDALQFLTEDSPQFRGIANGFVEHLARQDMTDEFLVSQLEWARGMLAYIIDPTTAEVPAEVTEGATEK